MRMTPQRICFRKMAKIPEMTRIAAMIQRIVASMMTSFRCGARGSQCLGAFGLRPSTSG